MQPPWDPFGPRASYKRWRLRRAARAYYNRLGPWLERRYGPASTHSAAQIEEAIAELGLNRNYIVFGYAAFLDEETFAALTPQMPEQLSFYDARTLLVLHGKYKGSMTPLRMRH